MERATPHSVGRFRSAALVAASVAVAFACLADGVVTAEPPVPAAMPPSDVAAAASGCHRVASPAGSDSAAGTEAAPFRTFRKLISVLHPGQYGCVRAGVYDEDPTIRVSGTAAAPITITSYPGEWATLYGRLSVEDNVSHVVVQHMTLDGSGAPSDGSSKLPSPTVHGDNVAFVSNEVTNQHTAICFAIGNESHGRAYNVEIVGNRIHDCGVLPPTNHQHGIYLHSPCCARVTDNWIHDNADTGLNLYPNADDNYFARNVVYGNADNLSFAARSKDGACVTSDRNLIERNVLSHPRVRDNITSWTPCGQHGTGNLLRDNCIYPATFEGSEGYALQNNLYVDPQYVNPANADFRLRPGSPCAAFLDHPKLPGTDPLPVPGIRPVAPPLGTRFGLGIGQLPGGPGARGAAGAVTLRSRRRSVRPGGRIALTGSVTPASRRKVRIELRRKRRWVRVRALAQARDGSFAGSLRLRRSRSGVARRSGLAVRRVRVPRGARALVLRAAVPRAGRSAPVRVRVRR